MRPFIDRVDAGRQLGQRLGAYAGRSDLLVLALPRGGVPVAAEVARALGAPLDVLVIRKLGAPGHAELAMGAIASGVRVINHDVVEALGIPAAAIEETEACERRELERREGLYRGGRPPLEVRGRTVILVDDGVATGSTVLAALRLLRSLRPARLVVAVPTAAPESVPTLRSEADEVIALTTPSPFLAISLWYEEFPQLTDGEIRKWLEAASRNPTAPSPAGRP